MRKVCICVILISLLSVYSCKDRGRQFNHSSVDSALMTLIGKKIPVLDPSVQDNKHKNYAILLCSPYDCVPCLDNAFAILKKVNSQINDNGNLVISVLDEPSSLQSNYEYYDYIMFDGDDIIRKELKYIPTPVFLILDKGHVILEYHFPTKNDNVLNISNLLIRQLN